MKYAKAGTKIAKWLSKNGYKVIKNIVKKGFDDTKEVSMLARTLNKFAVIKYRYDTCRCCAIPATHILKTAQDALKVFDNKESALDFLLK
jgi:hypothetical protein